MSQQKKWFSQPSKFINRIKEREYIKNYLDSNPEQILWIYWPKSTWKTTLMAKIIEDLEDDFLVSSVNYRRMAIIDYKTFIYRMYEDSKEIWNSVDSVAEATIKFYKEEYQEYKRKSEINFWFGKVSTEIRKDLENKFYDPFDYAIKVFEKIRQKWYKPVLVFDEIQELKDLYMDDNSDRRPILKELFKFCIALTKELHLCHVICMTSESTFVEEIYNTNKLKNTSKFFKIDHLSKEDIFEFTSEYWLTEKESELIWEKLWWSIQEVWDVIVDYKNWENLEKLLDAKVLSEHVRVRDFVIYNQKWKISEKDKEDALKIFKVLVEKWEYIVWKDWWLNFPLVAQLVEIDILFYDPNTWIITANSESVRQGLKWLTDNFA